MLRLTRMAVLGLLLLLVILPTGAIRSAPPAAPSDAVFGINSHIATRYPNYESLNVPADALGQLGLGWAREDFQWHRIEPRPGQYDWGFHDRMVELLSARGISIVGVLGPAVGWATPFNGDGNSDVSFYPPDAQRYADFARAVVARYRDRISYWQVWNEPENGIYWRPSPDAAAYANLLKTVYPVIKAANPNAQVLIGGTVAFDLSFLRAVAANGAWGSFDILAVHPYVDPSTPEEGQIGAAGVGAAKALADSLGPKPIWVTEFGWATSASDRDPIGQTDEDRQASLLVRAAVMLRAAGAERIIWYKFKDDGNFNSYGLYRFGRGLTDYGQAKPAFAALRTLNQQLAGATPLGFQDLGARRVVFDFENFGEWRRGNEPNGTFTRSSERVRGGSAAGQLSYSFPGGGNDYVVFQPRPALSIPGAPSQLGLWVYGDGSGHALKVWLRDAQGETLQFRLGFVGGGWQLLSTPINGIVESYNRISGSGNLRLDFPVTLTALVLDDEPDSASGNGTIFLDDLTSIDGPDAYNMRFSRGGSVVDVLWAPQGAQVNIPTSSAQGTLVDRSGGTAARNSSNGQFVLDLGPSPVYLIHNAGVVAQPTATPQPTAAPQPTAPPGSADGPFADAALRAVWERTDLPIARGAPGLQPRSWIWGPQPITEGLREPYAELPGGSRLVQYFDKSRMEINNPSAPRDRWYVTNGLLVIEMIEGRVRLGDSAAEERGPSDQAVAGDPAEANPNAPTYRSLRNVAFPINTTRAPRRTGEVVTEVLSRDGQVTTNPDLARYGVRLAAYSEQLGHNIPQVFTDYFAQQGVIYENGRFVRGQIIDWVFVMGLPISEPYWARVKIAGVEKDVLVQAFERRILTYTPSNDPAWRVEMGNVGQHYLRWRYGR